MADTTTATVSRRSKSPADELVYDRIFVREYVKDCNIGVFAEEQGVTQKVGFSIEAAVGAQVGSQRDDIADVPSYDNLTDAVDKTIAEGHTNLVETMADHIAQRVLSDDRFVWVRVRVEKLERGPAAVGIEIVRPRGVIARG